MATEGQAKLTLLLELKERLKSGMGRAQTMLNSGIGSMKAKLKELSITHTEVFSAMQDRVPGLGNALSLLTNPYVALTAGVIGLGTAYAKAANMSNEWQTGLAKVNVTAQLSKKELAQMSDKILDIGRRNTTPLMEVPAALDKIISAGLDVNTAFAALEPTLQAAKAGFTDVETTAAAAVNVMNSSGISDVKKVYDILFATKKSGNAEFADIANYLPKIIPAARAMGQSLEDTAGAFAYLTAQGWKSEQAATGLMNVTKALGNQSTIANLKKLKISVFDEQTGKARSLLDIVADLKKRITGLNDEQKNKVIGSIGLDMEASNALQVMMQDYDKLKDVIDLSRNSQGQLNEAVKNAAGPWDSWKILGNEVKAIMIEIGGPGAEIFGKIGNKILDTVNYFKALYNNSTLFRDVLSTIGTVAEISFKIAIIPIRLAWNILKNVWDAIISVKDAVFGAGTGFENLYVKVKPYLLWIYQYLSAIANAAYNVATADFSGIKEGLSQLKNAKSIDELKLQVKKEVTTTKEPKQTDLMPGHTPKETKGDKNISDTKINNNSNIDKVTGGQKEQSRNVTFNMDAMIKMGDFVSKNPQVQNMNKKELEQWFMELCKRVIMNTETSFS